MGRICRGAVGGADGSSFVERAAIRYGSKTFRNRSVPCKVYFCRVSELSGVCVRATHKTFFSQLLCPDPL